MGKKKKSQGSGEDAEEKGGLPEPPSVLTAGDLSSTKPCSGLHSAATRLPLEGSVGEACQPGDPGEKWGAPPSHAASPDPPLQALHALLGQQLPKLLAAPLQPLGLRGRAVGQEVLGAMRALRQLLGPRAGGQQLRSTAGGAARGEQPRPHSRSPPLAPPRAEPHLSTRPEGTSTAPGSASIGPPTAPARARPRPDHAPFRPASARS